jgi:ferric-dicitrate binding protein FerR (iron transport regulator)
MYSNKEIIDLYLQGRISKDQFLARMVDFGDEELQYFHMQLDQLSYSNQQLNHAKRREIWHHVQHHTLPNSRGKHLLGKLAIASVFLVLVVASIWLIVDKGSNPAMLEYVNNQDDIEIIQLPDHSRIHLHPGATLQYEEIHERKANLTGKALFDVSYQENKPFVVQTINSKTKVIGTVFTIDTDYEDQELIYLQEGKVRYEVYTKDSVLQKLELIPGDNIMYNPSRMEISSSTHNDEITLERDKGVLYLNKASIMEVKRILDDWYNIKLILPKEDKITERIVHKINTRHMSTKEVIDGINLIAGYKISHIKNNQYEVLK